MQRRPCITQSSSLYLNEGWLIPKASRSWAPTDTSQNPSVLDRGTGSPDQSWQVGVLLAKVLWPRISLYTHLTGTAGLQGRGPMSSSTIPFQVNPVPSGPLQEGGKGKGSELSTLSSSGPCPLVAGLVWARCGVDWAENLETCQRQMLLRNYAFPGK